MENKYLEKIDFYEILNVLYEYTSLKDTIALLEEQDIIKSQAKLEKLCSYVSIIMELVKIYDDYPNSNLESLNSSISLLKKENSRLSIEELVNIIFFFDEIVKINFFLEKNALNANNELVSFRDLVYFERELQDLKELLNKYIDTDECTLKRGAVKEYDEIDAKLKNLNKRIEKQIKQIINLNSEYLSSSLVYYKSDRYTLALKASFKSKIKGNIVSVSSSGETFYIEPSEITPENNELNFLNFEKERIIIKVLYELSNKLRTQISSITKLYNNFLYYDSLKARAIYGIKKGGIFPLISESLNVLEARHPLLLNPKEINFTPNEKRIVVITGPNAGGKTVTLKTVALLSTMFQFGIPIPVSELSTFKIFDNIFIDIGDEQSISSSLSTFSSHMNNISYILRHISKDSLLIFDEFCSGTDIEQGQALAISILEYLIKINAYVCLSTHYNALKYFAYTNTNVINASMQMDIEKMEPSYNLVFSVPGESFAFHVAKKSLILNEIIERATEIHASDKTELSKILEKLTKKEKEIYFLENSLKEKIELLKENEIELDEIRENLLLREKNIETELASEQETFLKDARKTLENLVREIKEGQVSTSKNKEFINIVEDKINKKKLKIESFQTISTNVQELKVGDNAKLKNSNTRGTIISIMKKNAILSTGSINITVSLLELEKIIKDKDLNFKNKKKFTYSFEGSSDVLSFIVDIRGMRAVEAIDFLSKKVDDMILKGISRFEIIHGKGEGLLSQAVAEFLKNLKFVKKYYFAHPDDGGAGKTIVEI